MMTDNDNNKKLILIRGLPGSGKSTLAKSLMHGYDYTHINDSAHYEADMYFINDNGEYCYNLKKRSNAHQWCQDRVEADMSCSSPFIIVSNTFVKHWEMEAYLKLAKQYEYTVQEITVKGDFGSIHDVPTQVIDRMRKDWQV